MDTEDFRFAGLPELPDTLLEDTKPEITERGSINSR
jgi:hypothetical protein